MDTSETYIKMRRKAIPDLGMGQPPSFSAGAEVVWLTTFVCVDIKGDFYYFSKDEQFQLERQDQLQEMLRFDYGDCDDYFLLEELYRWTREGPTPEDWQRPYTEKFTSLEQLWLAFVMKDKYNKVWNGEDWLVEKK